MNIKQRTCLKCNKPFESVGPANRICRRCQQINNRLTGTTEAQMKKQRGEKRRNGEPLE